MGKFEEIIITLSWIRLIQQQCVHFYYYNVGTKMCKRCFKRIQFFPLTELSTQNNVVPPILSSSYQSWVVPAPVLLSMGGCCRVTPTAWGLDGGSLDLEWAVWWLGWALMGSGWGLGDDWASPPTPVEPCDRTQPGPPKFQTITNPPPRILSPLKPLTLVTTPFPF